MHALRHRYNFECVLQGNVINRILLNQVGEGKSNVAPEIWPPKNQNLYDQGKPQNV